MANLTIPTKATNAVLSAVEVNAIVQAVNSKQDLLTIVNNLTTSSTGLVLDATQGKALKDLIDQLTTFVGTKESAIVAGTALQYFRGDKVFAVLNQDAVPSGITNKVFTGTEKDKLASLVNYTLPIASTTVVGGVKQGTNITIANDGTISSTGGSGTPTTDASLLTSGTLAIARLPTLGVSNISNLQSLLDGKSNVGHSQPASSITGLATVAITGAYADITGKPTLFSGSYTDLTNKPTIPTVPTNVSAFTNDSGYQTATNVTSAIAGKQDTLVSGTNIKTINGTSLLGGGNIAITGTGGSGSVSTNATLSGDGTSGNVLGVNPLTISITYTNIAALKAIRPATGTIAFTTGYLSTNDGGGGKYYFDSSSSEADDAGSVLIPTTGSGNGRWLLAPINGEINAKQFGAVGNGTTDDTVALQNAINRVARNGLYPADRVTSLFIPSGVYKTTAELTVGTLNPPFDPYGERSFVIRGAGPSGDYLYGQGNDNVGTQIRLFGTGLNSVLNNRRGASRYQRYENFTLTCDTLGGATYGLLFSDTRFSQPRVTNVHAVNSVNAFAVLKGTGANGEFITWEKCFGDTVQRFFYMDQTSGQAFDQMFIHCAGLIDDGGQMFEIGGSNLGFGITAYSFNSSAMDNAAYVGPNFNTLTGCTFFKNNGISGHANFHSGRQEHITTVLHNVSDSYNGSGEITFTGVEFDGMTCTATRPMLKSTGVNGTVNVTFQNTQFKGFYDNLAQVVFASSFVQGDASAFNFKGCHFWGNNIGFTNSYFSRITYDDQCTLKNIYNSTFHFANKTDLGIGLYERKLTGGNAHSAYGRPSNLLVNPSFTLASSTAGTGWTHTGNSTFATTVKGFPDASLNGWSSSPDAREVSFGANSGVYQDITAIDISQYDARCYYQAVIGFHDGGRKVRFALVNSSSGKVYDESFFMTSGNKQEFLVNLTAIDSQTTGNFRLVIQNVSGSAIPVDIKYQFVSNDLNATYINGGTATKEYTHNWSLNTDLARVTGRLQLPYKSDTFGSTNTLPDLTAGEMYISSTTSTEKVYTDRWEERPRQDRGTAVPTTGTWPLGFIRFNSNPTDTGNIGWVCVTAGTPGTWKAFGTIGTATGGSSGPYYSTTAATYAELQRVLNAATSGSKITLMPGTYDFGENTLNWNPAGKTDIVIEGGNNVVFTFGTLGRFLIGGSTTRLTISGIFFSCTSTTGNSSAVGQGLLEFNERGTHVDPFIRNCYFTAPTCLRNGIAWNTYSATNDGGDGTIAYLTRLKLSDCIFASIGRMGVEILNHTWSDNRTDVTIDGVDAKGCEFIDLGKINDSNGTTNGMALSLSGRARHLRFIDCGVIDGKTYGLEIVGTDGAVVTGCTFDYVNNSYIPISLADGYGNGIDATRNITIGNNFLRSKTRPMNSRGTTNLSLANNIFIGTTDDNSQSSSLYFQKCVGISLTGGSVSVGSFNPIRFDDCKEVVVNVPRVTGTNTTNNYASISIYSGSGYTGAGSQDYRLGINGGIFKKNNGITTVSGNIYETQGTVTGVVTF